VSVLGLIGLKTAGDYCFYTVGGVSSVLVGIKVKKGKPVVVPERIGKYTVRGIDDPFAPGPVGDSFNALKEKDQIRIRKKLEDYQLSSQLKMEQLPQSVEYIGFSMVSSNNSPISSVEHDILRIPSHVRYIRELRPSIGFHALILPESLRYLGKVRSSASLRVEFSGTAWEAPPFHSLSDYLGTPIEDVPQLGDLTFADCTKLHTLKLADSIEKIGKGALPSRLEIYAPGINTACEIHIPRLLQQVDPKDFTTTRVSTLNYPDDLNEGLRCQELPLSKVGCLIIHDMCELEQYAQLVTQGQLPERHPDKCLYHLIRRAERIVLPQVPKRICDGMFADCRDLYQVTIGTMPTAKNTALTISEGVETIGNDAFCQCSRLIPIEFPASLRHIGDRAFLGCKITKLVLPEGLEHIGKQAFAKCEKLKDFNIPSTVTYLAENAFEGCEQLRLIPDVLKRLDTFPEARDKLILPWQERVKALIEAGDQLLFRKNVTMADKQAAYLQYYKALDLDPFCEIIMHRLERLLLSVEVPYGIHPNDFSNLRDYLKAQQSTVLLELLESTLATLDDICVILSDPDEIITQRLVYGLNCDQNAATSLLKYLLDMVERHPKISANARSQIRGITELLIYAPTRNQDDDSQALFAEQKQRQQRIFPGRIYVSKVYNVIFDLTSNALMAHFRRAMDQNTEAGYFDAEFWLEVARAFNPNIEIPEAFHKKQAKYCAKKEAEQWRKEQECLVFPDVPVLPTWSVPSVSYREDTNDRYRYLDKEEEERLNQLTSDYWADVAAKADAAAIEDMWSDLDSMGFWSDTSWQ